MNDRKMALHAARERYKTAAWQLTAFAADPKLANTKAHETATLELEAAHQALLAFTTSEERSNE